MRTVAHGALGVVFAVYLGILGKSLVEIGLLLSVGMAGGAFFAFLVVLFGDTVSRRRLLAGFTLLTAGAASLLAVTDHLVILAAGAFLGSLAMGGGPPGGPVQPLEQASLPQTVGAHRRTDLFAVYGIVGTGAGAVGALFAGLPQVLQNFWGMGEVEAFRVLFAVLASLIGAGAALYALLSSQVEVAVTDGRRWSNPFKLRARRRIFGLTGLFTIDHFATGLVPHTLVALFFYERFGLDIGAIAFIFFGTQIMSMLSQWVASKIANRFGLINTIVFTHIPPTLMTAVIPFMPAAWMAVGLWLARGFFNMMDVPTKQSYTMAVVPPDERSAMAGLSNLTRSGASAVTPSIATAAWSAFAASMPFVGSAALKGVYLAALFASFRHVHTQEEQERMSNRTGQPAPERSA